MPHRPARASAEQSKTRARVELVFAQQKQCSKLFIRGDGLARAEATATVADIADTLGRWRW